MLVVGWKGRLPEPLELVGGGLGGVAGGLGLLAFYSALARGKMGIAAPISAVLTAALPVLWSRVHGRTPHAVSTGWLRARGAFDWDDLTPGRATTGTRSHRTTTRDRLALAGWVWLWVLLHPHHPRASRPHLLVSGSSPLHLHLC